MPIGSHLSVPLRLSNGRVYGTFCCFSFDPDITLNDRDLGIMKVFADLVAYQIEADVERTRGRAEKMERIKSTLQSAEPSIVYQPWYRLADMQIAGAEALSRFKSEPRRTPDVWFAEAADVGLQADLEVAAIRNAISGYKSVWRANALQLGVNSSPQTIIDRDLMREFEGLPADKVILEITEHVHVENYGPLLEALKPLRERGIKIAIDDAGSGYASMRHVLNIAPDFIKLDVSLTRNIDSDRMRRALASALIEFGQQTNCRIVAEGVETSSEMETLRELGAHKAQGYFLSHPLPLGEFRALLP
jgi:EAL domain-containing protein (putative c-di-GMP-specific phosphodiesterase class I)